MLAERCETSVKFISLIERGVTAPSFESIEKLARCLAVDVKEMFDFPMQEEKPKRVRRSLPPNKRSRGLSKRKKP